MVRKMGCTPTWGLAATSLRPSRSTRAASSVGAGAYEAAVGGTTGGGVPNGFDDTSGGCDSCDTQPAASTTGSSSRLTPGRTMAIPRSSAWEQTGTTPKGRGHYRLIQVL